MKKGIFIMLLCLTVPLVTSADEAIVFEHDGYYRIYGHYLRHLDQRNNINNVGFLDMRFRYEPIFKLTGSISIKAQIDMLDNVVWGYYPPGDELSVLENTPNDYGLETIGESAPDGALSNLYGPNGSSRNINVKRVWIEIVSFLGKLKIGRTDSHWGMGIFENNGNEYTRSARFLSPTPFHQEWGTSRFGDTRDSILLATKPLGRDKPFVLALRFDVFSEGSVYRPGDDEDRWSIIPLYMDRERNIYAGAFISYLRQPSSDTHIAIFDPYVKMAMPFHRNLNLEAEATVFLGKTGFMQGNTGELGYRGGDLTVKAVNAVGRISYNLPPLKFLTEAGYASPEKNGFEDGELTAIPMDPDFNIALLMFDYASAYFAGMLVDQKNLPANLSRLIPSDGAITNALWGRFQMKFAPVDTLSSAVQVVWAQGLEPLLTLYGDTLNVRGVTPAKHYGWELDWNFKFGLGENLMFDLQMGFLWPGRGIGNYLSEDGTTKRNSMIFGLTGGLTAYF